jgi:hypothetical protein
VAMQLRLLCVGILLLLYPNQSRGQQSVSQQEYDVTISHGFYQEGGNAIDAVAVGSKNGRMLAACLKQGSLYFFNLVTMAADPWRVHCACDKRGKRIGCLQKIAVACDGTVCAIRSDDQQIYRYYWPRAEAPITELSLAHSCRYAKSGHWEPVGATKWYARIPFQQLAVGNSNEIWGIDTYGTAYRLENEQWVSKPLDQKLHKLSVGYDGTVRAIDNQCTMYTYLNDQWIAIEGVPRLTKITVATKNLMWGIDEEQAYILWRYDHGIWKRARSKSGVLAKGFKDVSVNPAGTVFMVDLAGRLYANGENGVPIKVTASKADDEKDARIKKSSKRSKRFAKR